MLFNNLLPDIGGNDNDTKNKLPDFPLEKYAPFGGLADTFKKQGWIPERWDSETTEYHMPSYGQLNSIELNDGKGTKGYVSIKGGNKNGVFDLSIKDPNGKVVKTILKGVNAQTVNDYFTNTTSKDNYGGYQQGSIINQRTNQIINGQHGGSFASLF